MPSRTRSRQTVPPVYEYYYIDYSVGGTDLVQGPFLTGQDSETMIDVVTPNFRKKVKNGDTIINPLEYRRTARTSSGLGQSSYRKWNSSNVDLVSFTGSGPLTANAIVGDPKPSVSVNLNDSDMRRSAILNALASIDTTPLASGEDLAELGETLRFLRSPLRGILREAKKRNISSFVDVPASAWLTYRFAFSPLVRSIHDVLSEMKKPTKLPADIRVAHGRSQETDNASATREYSTGAGYYRTMQKSISTTGSAHAFIRYRVKNPMYNWRWRYGLRNKDILPTFWAVMPLSFMADRVFDVSSLIMATQNLADPSISILGSGVVTKREIKTSYQVLSQRTTNPRESYSCFGEIVTDTTFEMKRSSFKPSLGDVIPVFEPSGLVEDLTKTADFAALLRMFSRR